MIQRRNNPNDDLLEKRIQEQIKFHVGQEAEGFYISLARASGAVEAVAVGVEEATARAKMAQGDSVIHNVASSNSGQTTHGRHRTRLALGSAMWKVIFRPSLMNSRIRSTIA